LSRIDIHTKPPKVASGTIHSISSLNAGAMASLRNATWPAHQQLERRLDMKASFADTAAYRAYLEKMWGFCAAIEAQLDAQVFGAALADYDQRRKLPLIARDLLVLGLEPETVARLPRCKRLPHCADTSAAFGCAYVLEGATLGGRTLLPLVGSRLGLTAQHGASFLASYGDQTAIKWRAFGAALDAWCRPAAHTAVAVAAAVATFESLQHWLCKGAA